MTSTLPPPVEVEDEVAWYDAMRDLILAGRFDELDYPNLAEMLDAMAKRERRETVSRLRTLMAHLLKWQFQPEKRRGGWEATILEQRLQLEAALQDSTTLMNYAEEQIEKAYGKAVKLAAAETGLEASHFPAACPWTVETLLDESD